MVCSRGDSLIDSLCPIKPISMSVDRFSIGSMIVMIVGGVRLWDRIRMIGCIKGVSA